jgi:hypothetical protein
MSDRDLIVEVCHDLINRALLCERDGDGDHPTARDCREKEAAIRRMLVTPPPAVGLTAEDRANLLRARECVYQHHDWPWVTDTIDRLLAQPAVGLTEEEQRALRVALRIVSRASHGARCEVTVADCRLAIDTLRRLSEPATPPAGDRVMAVELTSFCDGCGKEIDPDTCGCGERGEGHGYHSGHPFVPMGCSCLRFGHADADIMRGLRERLRHVMHAIRAAGVTVIEVRPGDATPPEGKAESLPGEG